MNKTVDLLKLELTQKNKEIDRLIHYIEALESDFAAVNNQLIDADQTIFELRGVIND